MDDPVVPVEQQRELLKIFHEGFRLFFVVDNGGRSFPKQGVMKWACETMCVD